MTGDELTGRRVRIIIMNNYYERGKELSVRKGRKATWPIGDLWVLLVDIHSGGSSSSYSGSGSGKVVVAVRSR